MSKKRINSRQKGARIEREAAAFLTSIGYPAERMARIGKSADDIKCDSLQCHIEVKGDESIAVGKKALADAHDQALAQAAVNGGRQKAYVLWHRKRIGWFLTWGTVSCQRYILMTVGESDIAAVLKQHFAAVAESRPVVADDWRTG